MKRKLLFGLLIIFLITGAVKYFTLSDLRAPYSIPDDDPEKVTMLLKAMAKAHQTHLWEEIAAYKVDFS